MRPLAPMLLAAMLLATPGCKQPEEAPEALSEPSAWLFREFEAEDPMVLAEGVSALAAFFGTLDLEADWKDLRYLPEPLDYADLEGVDHPGRDPGSCLPVALVYPSGFSPEVHAAVMLLEDQTVVEPASPERYLREFLEPDDPSCFLDTTCDIRTLNDVVKENFLMTIPFEMRKDFRWVPSSTDAGAPLAIVARSWNPEEAVGEDGANIVHQSFSVDVFVPWAGGSVRYMALWSESTVPGVGDETMEDVILYGIHTMFEATDAYLAGEG